MHSRGVHLEAYHELATLLAKVDGLEEKARVVLRGNHASSGGRGRKGRTLTVRLCLCFRALARAYSCAHS